MTPSRPDTPRRTSPGRWTPADGWLLVAALCFLAGAITLIVTWYKVSGLALVAEQLPYLASGGLGGLALVVAGAGCLSAGRSARIEARLLDLLSVATEPIPPAGPAARSLPSVPVVDAPATGLTGPTGPTAPTGPGVPDEGAQPDGIVLTVPGGTTYHQPGCRLLAGKETTAMPIEQARAQELTACPVCH